MQIRKNTSSTRSGAKARLRVSAPVTEGINPIALDQLPPAALEHVANYFRTLAEPMRLRILNVLGTRELSVGEIAQQASSSIANISRHLSQMARHGLIARASRGNSVYYCIADPTVHALCELVCGSIARQYNEATSERAAFAGTAKAATATAAPARKIKRRAPPAS